MLNSYIWTRNGGIDGLVEQFASEDIDAFVEAELVLAHDWLFGLDVVVAVNARNTLLMPTLVDVLV